MFALKLPSQIKAGAAETVHQEKKARGELVEIVDPTAHLAWNRNKGGPVWGPKPAAQGDVQQANPAPDSPGYGPGDRQGGKGWNAPPTLGAMDPEKVQENPSPTKKTGPAWGGAGLAVPPARPPTDKARDNDWADECEVESGGKDRGFAAAAAPPVDACPRGIDQDIIRAREMADRQMQQDRGGVLGVAENWRGAGAYGGRGWPGDSGADGRQRAERHAVDSSVIRERWGGHNNTHTGLMRGEVKVLRRDSGGDTAAMDAVAAVASEREQLQNSDANPSKVEDGNNPAQTDSAEVRARPVQPQPQPQPRPAFASATHDPQDEVFRAMAVRRQRVDAEEERERWRAAEHAELEAKRRAQQGTASPSKSPVMRP